MKRIGAVLLVLVFAFAGCTKSGGGGGSTTTTTTTATNAPVTNGGVLRVANYAEPTSLNPILITNTAENFIMSLAFDPLVTLDDQGNDVPDLAAVVPTTQNGGISKDGLTYTYHLRKNVTWQDGAPFSSADVKYTWQQVMNPNNNVVERRGYDEVKSVDTPDPYTVVFHLKQPFSPFVHTVFGESDDVFRILPKHLLAQYPNLNRVPFNDQPIGTGAFKVARWVHGDHVELVANPHYFRGAPHLSKIMVYYVPDGNTASAELRSHGTDLIIDVTAANYNVLKSAAGVKTLLVRAPTYNSIVFNWSHPPLNDLRVRQAISYAINEKTIINNLEHGTAIPAAADLSDFYRWAYDPNVQTYPYNPAKANQLLDAAGWTRGANGMRSKNGQPLSLQLVYGQGSETARQIGVELQSDLHNVGIDVPIKTYTYTMLYATKQEGGIQQSGKFDITEFAWVSGSDPDDSSQWLCSMKPPVGNNISNYCNAQLDAAEQTALSHADVATRKKAYATTQSILASDAASAFMFYSRLRYAMNPKLQNFKPNGPSEGWNANQWSI